MTSKKDRKGMTQIWVSKADRDRIKKVSLDNGIIMEKATHLAISKWCEDLQNGMGWMDLITKK